jgi:hypothetical protein
MHKIAGNLRTGCDIKTACNICGIGTQTFRDWRERAERGEAPYERLFSVASRARDMYKARLLKIVLDAAEGISARHADWKAAAWVLEKGWPREYAPFERRPVPVESQPPKPVPDLSHMVKFTLHGHPEIDLGEVIHARCVIAAYEKAMAASRRVVPSTTAEAKPDADGGLLDNNPDALDGNGSPQSAL